MGPERAFGLGLRIASEVYGKLGDRATVEEARELLLTTARRLGATDADAGDLVAVWPRVMQRIDELQNRVISQETERARVGIGNIIRRARSLQ